jgi:hypothetical protein
VGEWQLAVQTTARVVGSAGCGVRGAPHGRRVVRVRDITYRSAAGRWTWWPTPPGPRWTAGSAPDRTAGCPGRHRRPGSLARVRQRAGHPAGPCERGGGPLPRYPPGEHGGRPDSAAGTAGHPGPPGPQARPAVSEIRRLLLTAAEQLTDRRRARLWAGLAAGDSGGEVAAAWQGKELLRAVYAAVGTAGARAALDHFYRWAGGVRVAELSRLARTVRVWDAKILAFHATGGCSNGPPGHEPCRSSRSADGHPRGIMPPRRPRRYQGWSSEERRARVTSQLAQADRTLGEEAPWEPRRQRVG